MLLPVLGRLVLQRHFFATEVTEDTEGFQEAGLQRSGLPKRAVGARGPEKLCALCVLCGKSLWTLQLILGLTAAPCPLASVSVTIPRRSSAMVRRGARTLILEEHAQRITRFEELFEAVLEEYHKDGSDARMYKIITRRYVSCHYKKQL